MSIFADGRRGRRCAALAIIAAGLFLAGCGRPYAAQLSTVEGLLAAARAGDEARAGELMPALLKVSPEDRKRALAALAAMGEGEVAGVAAGPGGYVVSLRFGKPGAKRTIAFPLLSEGGKYRIGDVVTTEEHFDIVPLGEAR
jgi:hypothetical protein